jgi:hypothetical protein
MGDKSESSQRYCQRSSGRGFHKLGPTTAVFTLARLIVNAPQYLGAVEDRKQHKRDHEHQGHYPRTTEITD